MKKVLLFSSIIILALYGGRASLRLDAQEVTAGSGTLSFGGKVIGGIVYDADDTVKKTPAGIEINSDYIGEDGRVRLLNESENTTLRTELTTSYINQNIGFRIRLRADNVFEGIDSAVTARYAYGWVDLFNEGLKFTGGFIDLSDNVWGTLGDGDWDIGGNGLRVEVKPFKFFNLNETVAGSFNIGAFFMIPTQDNSNIGRDDQGKPVYRTVTPARVLKETAFGFRYTHPWGYAGVQLKLDSDIDGVDIFKGVGQTITSADRVWSGAEDETRLMFGVGFTMLPELTVTAEGNFEGLGNWEARGKGDLRQTVSYTFFGKLILGLKAQEILWGYDLKAHVDYPIELSPWIQIKPFVNYMLSPEFTAGLEAGFGSGYMVTGSLEPESSNNGQSNNKDRNFVNEKYNIYVKPNLAYNFSKGLALKLWYKAAFIGYADLGDDPMFKDLRQSASPVDANNYTRVDSLLKHQIALEFIWSF
jgi:hypothetical protein